MLGAVAGGLIENLSLATGMRALLLVAIAIYILAAVGLLYEEVIPDVQADHVRVTPLETAER